MSKKLTLFILLISNIILAQNFNKISQVKGNLEYQILIPNSFKSIDRIANIAPHLLYFRGNQNNGTSRISLRAYPTDKKTFKEAVLEYDEKDKSYYGKSLSKQNFLKKKINERFFLNFTTHLKRESLNEKSLIYLSKEQSYLIELKITFQTDKFDQSVEVMEKIAQSFKIATSRQLKKSNQNYSKKTNSHYNLNNMAEIRLIALVDKSSNGENLADKIITKYIKGESFSDLAKEYSKDKNYAKKGGYLGWIKKNYLVKEYNDAVFNHKKGECFKVFSKDYGWAVILKQDEK